MDSAWIFSLVDLTKIFILQKTTPHNSSQKKKNYKEVREQLTSTKLSVVQIIHPRVSKCHIYTLLFLIN